MQVKIKDPLNCPSVVLEGGFVLGSAGCDVCIPSDIPSNGLVWVDCAATADSPYGATCDWKRNNDEIKDDNIEVSQSGSQASLFISRNFESYVDESFTCVCKHGDQMDTKDTKFFTNC